MSRRTVSAYLLLLCALLSPSAFAQTNPVNPTIVEFSPSTDDGALTADGQPMVTRYDLQIFLVGAAQPMSTTSLGKPSPDPDGVVRVNFTALLVAWPLATGTYQARVAAVGPTGTGLSDLSNQFDCQASLPACTYALSPTAQAADPTGGALGVAVTTSATTCGWTATSDSAWATVAPASGTGSGSVTVTVAANTGTARTATVTIGGQTFSVTQAAVPPCTFSLGASSSSLTSAAGTTSVAVTASATTCGWTATSDSAWATVAPASGTGSGSVTVTVAANTGTARTATVTIGGQTFSVTQAAVPPCTFSLGGSSSSLTSSAGTTSVAVTASATTCGWTATSDSAWATVAPASGTGSGSVTVTVTANTGTARTATVTIGGQTFGVAQAAAPPCSYSVSPTSVSASASGGTASLALTASAGTCGWTATASAAWITVGAASGTGSRAIPYTLSRNATGAARTGTITVGGKTVGISQSSLTRPGQPRGVHISSNGSGG